MIDIKRTRTTDEGSYTAMAYVMTLDGKEIGWASLSVDSESAYCERIDIDEAYRNQGYGTKLHYAMLDQYGPCPAHRVTFLKKWEARKP